MSWLYWPPKSRTSTGRSCGEGSGAGKGRTSASAIVRRVLRDRDVVWMALAEPRSGDADEPRLLQVFERRRAAVAHRLPEPADELVDDRPERPLVRDATLDPLRDELGDVLDVALEVAVLRERARLHRAERAHPAVLLEPLALDDQDASGRLVRAGEHRAEHDGVGAGGDRLRDVARRRETAVGDQGHALLRGQVGTVVDRGDLGHPDAGDNAGR